MKLPDLIDRLYKIVKLQQIDCTRALYCHGNYELAPWMSKLKVQHIHWTRGGKETVQNVHGRDATSGGTTGVQTVRRTGAHGPRGPIQAPYY